jgi:phosphoribosylaminoimidazole-succinocarboxamide synthase
MATLLGGAKMLEKKDKVYEGKAKILYSTADTNYLIQYFKDDATAFNAKKKGTIVNKGILNNHISSRIFEYLEKNGIRTHYKERLNDREMAVRSVKIIPIEVVIRNRVAGSLAKRLGMAEGTALQKPILEFFYKSDELDDPMISENCAVAFGWLTERELSFLKTQAWKINDCMRRFFDERGIELVDYKLEFGKDADGEILLADEISPDSCRLWEKETGEKLDKDRFRRDLGGVEEAYQKVYQAVCGDSSASIKAKVYVTLKKGVLDPQGKTVERALHSLGFHEIKDVRVGKYIELSLPYDLTLEEAQKKAQDQLKQISEKLLSNTVIEDYRFELVDQKR